MIAPKRRSDLRFWDMDDEVVMYDPASGMGHVLNPTAVHIWAFCDGRHSAADIEKSLAEHFPEDAQRIKRDVRAAISQFSDLGLLDATA